MKKVALLRGVNVGGKNKIKMADLKAALISSGFLKVQTYIQSGNLILEKENDFQSQEIQSLIKVSFNVVCDVFLFNEDTFKSLISSFPFEINEETLSKNYFTFIPSRGENLEAIEGKDFGNDRFLVSNQVIYIQYNTKYSDSKLNNSSIEKLLNLTATTRNMKTCYKLITMLDN